MGRQTAERVGALIKAKNIVVSQEVDRQAYGLLISGSTARSARGSGSRGLDHRKPPQKRAFSNLLPRRPPRSARPKKKASDASQQGLSVDFVRRLLAMTIKVKKGISLRRCKPITCGSSRIYNAAHAARLTLPSCYGRRCGAKVVASPCRYADDRRCTL